MRDISSISTSPCPAGKNGLITAIVCKVKKLDAFQQPVSDSQIIYECSLGGANYKLPKCKCGNVISNRCTDTDFLGLRKLERYFSDIKLKLKIKYFNN
jgi:hypothetical protein